jgi:hypothetical protein
MPCATPFIWSSGIDSSSTLFVRSIPSGRGTKKAPADSTFCRLGAPVIQTT